MPTFMKKDLPTWLRVANWDKFNGTALTLVLANDNDDDDFR